MTVLHLTGKPIDWHNPPKPTTTVLWSERDVYGRKITGSFRCIAHLDLLQRRCQARFGRKFRIIQPPNNKGVAKSAGTHDYDFCFDADIPGVPWVDVNHFFRSNGVGGWVRTPAQGFSYHWHGFTLPPREGKSISDDFKVYGFKVGKYVDGGYSTQGRLVTSSQIADYYAHAFGLSGHHRPGSDKSWYPKDIPRTIFILDREIRRQQAANPKPGPNPPKPPPEPVTPTLSLREVAQQVLDGKWGNGETRITRLKRAGYNPEKVQEEVNRLLRDIPPPEPKPKPKPEPKPNPTPPGHVDIRVGHLSMRYSRTIKQWRSDAEKVFSRGYEWITGTEAGEADNYQVLVEAAHNYGYRITRFRDVWIAVDLSIITEGTWKVGKVIVAENEQTWGRGHDTVVLAVSFTHKTPGVGTISVLASHYPNRGKPEAKDPAYRVNLRWTKATAEEVAGMMKRLGAGSALCFYGGDQNMSDKLSDTFFGAPIETAGDALDKHPGTGFGPIDVIARYERDARTSFTSWNVYDDSKMFFHTDHFLCEATIRVVLLPTT